MPNYTGDLHALLGDTGIVADWCIIAYPRGVVDGDKILVAGVVASGTSAADGTFTAELDQTPDLSAAYYVLKSSGKHWPFQTEPRYAHTPIGASITKGDS